MARKTRGELENERRVMVAQVGVVNAAKESGLTHQTVSNFASGKSIKRASERLLAAACVNSIADRADKLRAELKALEKIYPKCVQWAEEVM